MSYEKCSTLELNRAADRHGSVGSPTTTMNHYVKDVGACGNVFRNQDEGSVTIRELKRSLPVSSLRPSSEVESGSPVTVGRVLAGR